LQVWFEPVHVPLVAQLAVPVQSLEPLHPHWYAPPRRRHFGPGLQVVVQLAHVCPLPPHASSPMPFWHVPVASQHPPLQRSPPAQFVLHWPALHV
jgi:hypothetical protein